MFIALDYDKTYTADPALWDAFIQLAQNRKHTIKIVTMRYPLETIENAPCEVIYTSRKAKAAVVNADIWIDDRPQWIYEDSL
jgi:hypothetical protein